MREPSRLRLHALVACLLALVLALAGCGGTGQGKGETKGGDSSSASKDTGDADGDGDEDEPAPDPGFEAPRVGACTRMTAVQSRASVAPPADVSCAKQHTTVVAYVGYSRRPISPATPLETRRMLAERLCEPTFRAWVGGTEIDRATSLLTWTFFTPSQAQLERGARWVRCDVLARSGSALVPLPDHRPLIGRTGASRALRVCQTKAAVDVTCAGPHAFEVAAVFRGAGRRYPGVTGIAARNRCRQLQGGYGGYVQYPSRAGWTAGDRFVRCLTPAGGLPKPAPSPSPTP